MIHLSNHMATTIHPQTETPAPSTDRRLSISYRQGYVLRGIAMLMIIFVHCINEYPAYTHPISKGLLIPMWGQIGSSVFLFMSGYGLFISMTSKEELKVSYLLQHIQKILEPFLVAFVLCFPMVAIAHQCGEDYDLQLVNLLWLSMPTGIDMWFLKTILLFYIFTFFIVRWVKTTRGRTVCLGAIMLTHIVILYLNRVPGYWYVSNLPFLCGVFCSQATTIGHRHRSHAPALFVLAVLLYAACCCEIQKAPLLILENIVFALCFVLSVLRLDVNKRIYDPFVFIGRNSLLYYTLNVPVMIALCSQHMNCPLYFIANLAITSLLVLLYNKIRKRTFQR